MTMLRAILLAAATAALATMAQAQTVKHFRDWTAVCDNLKRCSAFGCASDHADSDAFIRVSRAAGPLAEPIVALVVETQDGSEAKAGTEWRVKIDGVSPPGLSAIAAASGDDGLRAILTAAQSKVLIAALRAGAEVSVSIGQIAATIGLSGSSAALLWIDEGQCRIGATDAMAARGARSALGAFAAPGPPVLRAAAAVSQAGPPTRLPRPIRDNPALKDCGAGDALSQEPLVARLGPGQILWGAPCSAGACNLLSVLFVADEAGRGAREITPRDAEASDPNSDQEMMNVEYDAKSLTLSSFAKARGLGDCGSRASWVWDGKRFELLDEWVMPDCQGVAPDDWPSLYHAVIAR